MLRQSPAGLIVDIDGTISPIVARPIDATVLPQARLALKELRSRLACVAIVTGRRVPDARRMVGLNGLAYIGNHGLETWGPRSGTVEQSAVVAHWQPRLQRFLDCLAATIPTDRGVTIEDKGLTASLHYRLANDPTSARAAIFAAIYACRPQTEVAIEEGRMVVNLLPPVAINKGTAVLDLAREHGLRGLVYLGDDVTDIHAFEALRTLRESAVCHTLSIAVVAPESAPAVRSAADESVPSPADAAALLAEVAHALAASAQTMRD